MSDTPKRPDQQVNEQGYVPASPMKRTLAWIGLAYAVIMLALTTYFFFRGKMLGNLAPLLTVPGLIGLGALAIVTWRTTDKLGKLPAILIAIVCWALALATLPMGIVGLLSNFPGALEGLAEFLSKAAPGMDVAFITAVSAGG